MTRLNVWNSCNRVFDEKLQDERRELHRARLESIHNTHSLSVASLGTAYEQRGTAPKSFKALPKSKSPAAKSRQAEIERENLKMIKRIVELQKGSSSGAVKKSTCGEKRQSRPASASARTGCSTQCHDTSYVPNPLTGLAPGGSLGVPTADSHPLYTRHAATMTHHFQEQNDIPTNFVPGQRSTASTRHRTQVQIVDENRKLLKRILSSKTTFSRSAWQAEEKERRKLLNNISRYAHLHKQQPSHKRVGSSPTAWSHGCEIQSVQRSASHSALVVVDHRVASRLDLSDAVRTGSPVTHLRHRPQSASATGVRLSDGYTGNLTRAMSQLGINEQDANDR